MLLVCAKGTNAGSLAYQLKQQGYSQVKLLAEEWRVGQRKECRLQRVRTGDKCNHLFKGAVSFTAIERSNC